MINKYMNTIPYPGIRVRNLSYNPLPAHDDLGRVHTEAVVRIRRVRSGAGGHGVRCHTGRVALAHAAPLQLTKAPKLDHSFIWTGLRLGVLSEWSDNC